MSDVLFRASLIFAGWTLALLLANPWLEKRGLRIAALATGITASLCCILQGFYA